MVKNINILNKVTNKQITIGEKSNVYVIEQIDWDSPIIEMPTYRVPFQIGETLSGVVVGTRSPSIIGYIVADMSEVNTSGMTWEQYYRIQEQMIEKSKEELNKIISIYQDLKIEADGYYLDARPALPPKYANNYEENNEVLCMFELQLICYNPLFYNENKTYNLAMTVGKFHFPLIIPPEKVVFGEVTKRQSVLIENDGDVNCGCIIKIKASGGTVMNPKVYNVNTGDFIGFEDLTLEDGDTLIITTEVREENAIRHIVSEKKDVSVVGKILTGSKFIQIEKGSSYYAYEVEEQSKNNVEVSIEFVQKYFNIGGM